eukprot:6499244-Heterocapsa_arctica.AAC.1
MSCALARSRARGRKLTVCKDVACVRSRCTPKKSTSGAITCCLAGASGVPSSLNTVPASFWPLPRAVDASV